jgi:hypothetical protein
VVPTQANSVEISAPSRNWCACWVGFVY